MSTKRKPQESGLAEVCIRAAKSQIERWETEGYWDHGGRYSAMFFFVRDLMGTKYLSGITDPEVVMEKISRAFPRRHPEDMNYVWDLLGFGELDDPSMEFIETWDSIKFPAHLSPLVLAFNLAIENPLSPVDGEKWTSAEFGRFISLAGWLQVVVGDEDIFLPVEQVGKYLKLSAMCISRHRSYAQKKGFLTLTEEHIPHSKASRFRSSFRKWECLEIEYEKRHFGSDVN